MDQRKEIRMIRKLKRVAAYCRVSVESELMQSSITNQIAHFTNKINDNPLWQNAGVFAEYGISGTNTKNRPQFNRMIALALQGKIDLILAKSIQRFARNTVDLLATIRQLKEHNVEVFFEKENISTFSHDGELMLSIMASFAQEESRSISDNVRWGIKKRFEQGIPNGRNPVFGYDWKGDDLVVNENEGWIVTKMFQDYANGMRVRDILEWMNQTGVKTRKGNKFQAATIKAILRNPTYTGVLLLCKEYVGDPIVHDRHKNQGELPQYLAEGHHEPLVDEETWQKAQERTEQNRRSNMSRKTINAFTGKLKCKDCGRNFQRITQRYKGKLTLYWQCYSRRNHLAECHSIDLDEPTLETIAARMLEMKKFDPTFFRAQVEAIEVEPDGTLEFHFTDGRRKTCKYEKSQ